MQNSLNIYLFTREKEDIDTATWDSLEDEFNRELEEEVELTCGVALCPQSQTVWKEESRRDKHM